MVSRLFRERIGREENFDTKVLLQQITLVLNFDFCLFRESGRSNRPRTRTAEWPVFLYTFKLRMYTKAGLYLRLQKRQGKYEQARSGLLTC